MNTIGAEKTRRMVIGCPLLLAIAVCTILQPATLSAETQHKGATVRLLTTDGQEVRGELLRVGDDKLLVMNGSGEGITVPFTAIRSLAIKNRNRFGKGALIGAAVSLVYSAIVAACDAGPDFVHNKFSFQLTFTLIPTALLGGVIGAASAAYRDYPLSASPAERTVQLIALRKMAHFKES